MLNIFFIVLPVFLVIFVGRLLKWLKLIDGPFITSANKLVFNVCLPVLLFHKISAADIHKILDFKIIMIMFAAVLAVFFITMFMSKIKLIPEESASVFMMNSFRSNFAYMGLPVSFYAYGDAGLLNASILMAFIVPYVNTFSVISLSLFSAKKSFKAIAKSTLLNPLAIACILGIAAAYMNLTFFPFITTTLGIISGITLPLALFCIGASLNMDAYKGKLPVISLSILFKLAILPLIAYIMLRIFIGPLDITGKVLVILLASPSATVNYVLAASMNGDAEVTNSTIVSTTLLSIFTYIIWLNFMGL